MADYYCIYLDDEMDLALANCPDGIYEEEFGAIMFGVMIARQVDTTRWLSEPFRCPGCGGVFEERPGISTWIPTLEQAVAGYAPLAYQLCAECSDAPLDDRELVVEKVRKILAGRSVNPN